MNNYITIEETELGLKISLKAEGREELLKVKYTHSFEDIWKRLFKSNKQPSKEYFIIKSEMVGVLPGTPVVGKNISVDKNGQMHFEEDLKLWWFPDYILVDEFDEMLTEGHVYFTKA